MVIVIQKKSVDGTGGLVMDELSQIVGSVYRIDYPYRPGDYELMDT
mgnify:CR=1 FL=1